MAAPVRTPSGHTNRTRTATAGTEPIGRKAPASRSAEGHLEDTVAAMLAVLAGTLILAAMMYDAARLITPREPRCPPLARLLGRRAALEAAERWCVGLRL